MSDAAAALRIAIAAGVGGASVGAAIAGPAWSSWWSGDRIGWQPCLHQRNFCSCSSIKYGR